MAAKKEEIALHTIVTDCRLCACLTDAYYKKVAKSFLWHEGGGQEGGGRAQGGQESQLIKPSQIEYPDLDQFPPAAYVLDYPDLGTEEPPTIFETSSEESTTYAEVCQSMQQYAVHVGQEDSKLVYAFFATHAAGENQGSSWPGPAGQCNKVVIFNVSNLCLLLDDRDRGLTNYSLNPWSVYHVEPATRARVASIVMRHTSKEPTYAYKFIVLGYNNKKKGGQWKGGQDICANLERYDSSS